MTAVRAALYQRVSASLGSRSDVELAALVGTGRVISVGVGGGAEVVDIDSVPVFTKRIPLTDREVANSASTANLFDLPMFCQYCIGGTSFNAWPVRPGSRRPPTSTPTPTSLLLHRAVHGPCGRVSKHWPPRRAAWCCSASTSRIRSRTGCESTRLIKLCPLCSSFHRS